MTENYFEICKEYLRDIEILSVGIDTTYYAEDINWLKCFNKTGRKPIYESFEKVINALLPMKKQAFRAVYLQVIFHLKENCKLPRPIIKYIFGMISYKQRYVDVRDSRNLCWIGKCTKKQVYKKYDYLNYCEEHICRNCDKCVLDGKCDYCDSHRCKIQDCNKKIGIYYHYCDDHTCRCGNGVMQGKTYCKRCDQKRCSGCKKILYYYSISICDECKCQTKNCNDIKVSEKFCQKCLVRAKWGK